MKVTELLEGQFTPNKLSKSVEEIAMIIQSNCTTFLRAYKSSKIALLRGVDGGNMKAMVANIRPDRRPVDVDPRFHELLHHAYLKAGLKATRKNSIFCTTELNEADSWGDVHIVFAKDGWEGTVFKKISKTHTFDKMLDLDHKMSRKGNYSVDAIADQLMKYEPTRVNPNNFASILRTHHEIIITGESYIGLKLDSDMTPKILAILDLTFTNVDEDFL